ncbi:hypothetical protein [Streptomyces sp. NPDC096033]|uniref:hypothetical protein n=1 Tax=Streptomyces sp. NPDC096033 TaxID=3366071 RepID=UPI0037FE86B0
MQPQTAPAGAGNPPTPTTAVATDGEPRIVLDERVMEEIARRAGVYEELFPMRRALDPQAVEQMIQTGRLSPEDVQPAILLINP